MHKLFLATVFTLLVSCASRINVAPAANNTATLVVALCESGEPAVDIWRVQSKGATGETHQYRRPESPSILYLRPGTYLVDVACNRNVTSCGYNKGWVYVDNAPTNKIKVLDGDKLKVDCVGETGDAFFKNTK